MSTARSRRRNRWFAATAVALSLVIASAGLVGAASPDPSPSPQASPTGPIEVPVPINLGAIVGIQVAGATRQGDSVTAEGYGVVVDPSGIILAPANLVAPETPGVAVHYMNWNLPASVATITVRVAPTGGQALSDEYTARVLAVDGWLDTAVLALDPAPTVPLTAIGLSTVTPEIDQEVVVIDTSASGSVPAPIVAVGYQAFILDLSTDPRIESGPGWLTTDEFMPEALPAVLITEPSGLLVAFSSFEAGFPPFLADGRPVALLQPLLEAAMAATPYTSPYVVPGSGDEALQFDTWATTQENVCDAADPGRVETFPSGAPSIAALFSATGMTEGEDVVNVWWDPVSRQLISLGGFRWQGSSDGCMFSRLNGPEGEGLSDGDYALTNFVGGTLRQAAFQTTTVGGAIEPGSVSPSGTLIDGDTGDPIEGAFVVILEQGVDPGTWFQSPNDDEVASSAITDEEGAFETSPPIQPGVWPFIIQAFGYQAIGGTFDFTRGPFLPPISLTPLE